MALLGVQGQLPYAAAQNLRALLRALKIVKALICFMRARARLGPGPFGPGPVWAQAHLGPSPFVPGFGPIWALAQFGPWPNLGPGPLGPCPLHCINKIKLIAFW